MEPCPKCKGVGVRYASDPLRNRFRELIGDHKRYCPDCRLRWAVHEPPARKLARRLAFAAAAAAAFALYLRHAGRNAQLAARADNRAYLGALNGAVDARAPGAAEWSPAVAGQALRSGGALRAGEGASAIVAFTDGSRARLSAGGMLVVEETSSVRIELALAAGSLDAWVSKRAGRRFVVRSPVAADEARGTVFTVRAEGLSRSTLDVFEGSVANTDHLGRTVLAAAGSRVVTEALNGGGEPSPSPRGVAAPAPPPALLAEAPPPEPPPPAGWSPITGERLASPLANETDRGVAGAVKSILPLSLSESLSSFMGIDKDQVKHDLDRMNKQQLWDKYGHYFASKDEAKAAYEQYKAAKTSGAPPAQATK